MVIKMGKKRTAVLLMTALLVFTALFVGCSERESGQEEIDLSAAAQSALSEAGFSEELVALDENTILRRYPTLDLTKVESYEVYVSGSMGTAEELGLFKAKSSGDLKDIRAAVDRRIEDLKLNFEDYRPDEMPKIEDAVIVEKGSYLLFAIVPESTAVRELFEGL
ncbi:MAG: DUF4358 domain-containing protein [Provencibacterium sp.]|nr:DUF4358 domain-containing protein [Provencibacterium sp.]